MSDLAEFLLQRIAEDERAARAAAPGPWDYGSVVSVAGGGLYDPTVLIASLHYEQPGEVDPRIRRTVLSEEADNTGVHIARWDPERVLAEVAIKRRIVELHKPYPRIFGVGCDICLQARHLPADAPGWPCETLRLLAVSYSSHPDYRAEWRPRVLGVENRQTAGAE